MPRQRLPDPELGDDPPEQKPPWENDPELDDDELDLDDELEPSKSDSGLPPMYCYGDPDPRPIKSWAIKRLMPAIGHGVLAGSGGPTRPSPRLILPRA